MWWLRLTAGVLFLIGGWQTAIGLRPGDGATAWWGVGLIAMGLSLEVLRGWWQRPVRATNQGPNAEAGAAAKGGG